MLRMHPGAHDKIMTTETFMKGGAKLADSVTEYAASEMKYWCTTGDYGGTGYAQDNRWVCYLEQQ